MQIIGHFAYPSQIRQNAIFSQMSDIMLVQENSDDSKFLLQLNESMLVQEKYYKTRGKRLNYCSDPETMKCFVAWILLLAACLGMT